MTTKVRVDLSTSVTSSEAVNLFVHHLALAICFFEAGPAQLAPFLSALREAELDGERLAACLDFVEYLNKAYENMEDEG